MSSARRLMGGGKKLAVLLAVGVAAIALAGCAFTSPNGSHVIYNPFNALTVQCNDQQGCTSPVNGAQFAWHTQMPVKLAAGLWHTLGTAPGAAECHFARIGADGRTIMTVDSPIGQRYVQTGPNDSQFQSSGCQPWILADSPQDTHHFGVVGYPFNQSTEFFKLVLGDGDYRMGNQNFFNETTGFWAGSPGWTNDIPYGRYQLQNGTACHFEVLRNFTGENGSVSLSGDGSGDGHFAPGSVDVPGPSLPPSVSGQPATDVVGLRLFHCGSPDIFWYGNAG